MACVDGTGNKLKIGLSFFGTQCCSTAPLRLNSAHGGEAARHRINQSRITFATKPSTSAITVPKPHRR